MRKLFVLFILSMSTISLYANQEKYYSLNQICSFYGTTNLSCQSIPFCRTSKPKCAPLKGVSGYAKARCGEANQPYMSTEDSEYICSLMITCQWQEATCVANGN